MSDWFIHTCRLCGAKYKIGNMQVYRGDETCCPKCNQDVENNLDYTTNKLR